MENFLELNLNETLRRSIARMHFKVPTPIQSEAIPHALNGKDILGTAQTGTGKTLCYGIACLNKLLIDKASSALIICPTRELAVQVGQVLNDLIENKMNIQSAVLIGGESMQRQLKQLSRRPRLIIGTPGRLNDHLKRKSLRLHETYFLVLDETDRILDMGFAPQIEQILKFIPKRHQTLLFSATLPQNIIRIAEKYLSEPVRISVGSTTKPISKIKQEVIQVNEADKYNKLLDQLYERKGSILVFVKTKRNADKMVDRLCRDGHKCDTMHGNLRQSKRQRTLTAFRSGKLRILISTELAARGLDVPSIQHVINYHLPQVAEDFIHRIGRTARAGKKVVHLHFLLQTTSKCGKKYRNLLIQICIRNLMVLKNLIIEKIKNFQDLANIKKIKIILRVEKTSLVLEIEERKNLVLKIILNKKEIESNFIHNFLIYIPIILVFGTILSVKAKFFQNTIYLN